MEGFDRFAGALDFPMFIVTTRASEGEKSGCLVGFVTQASIDPLLFHVCLSNKNHTYRLALEAEWLSLQVVPADAWDLAELFGSKTGDEIDKFDRCEWREGPHGVPLLDRCEGWVVARVLEHFPTGDHETFLVEPVEGHGFEAPPLNYQRARTLEPGHEA